MTDREYQRIYLIVEKALVTPEMRRHLATLTEFGSEPEIERLREQLAAANAEIETVRRWLAKATDELAHHMKVAVQGRQQLAAANADIEMLRAECRAYEQRIPELCAAYIEQLSAVTKARDEAIKIANYWTPRPNSERNVGQRDRERLAELQKVGQ